MRWMTSLTALCIGLVGCAASRPDDVLNRVAAGRSEEGLVAAAAGTSRDGLAMQAARDRVERDLAGANVGTGAPPPAAPAAEEVTVVAPRSFAGNWRLVSPTTLTAHANSDATYEDVQTFICRFEQHATALSGACLPSRKKIEGSVEGDRVTLDWSRGLASAGMTGTLLSPTDFRGTLSIGALGVRVSTDIPAYGSKLGRSTAPEESDRVAGEVLRELARGEVRPDRLTGAVLGRLRDAPPFSQREKQALGSPVDQVFLDRIELPADGDGQTMAVYELEFEGGWRLCGVIQDAAWQVDGIDCS